MRQNITILILIILFVISCNDKKGKIIFNIKEIKYVTHNSAIVNAEISGENYIYDIINEKGICFAEHNNPTIEDYYIDGKNNFGEFTSYISGLKANTTYYIRIYAKTSDGIVYSNSSSIVTKDVEYFTDTRDGQKYPIIKIGNQTWFAANLNYKTKEGSFYYNNDSTKYASEYGRLYTYEAALSGCPDGWHLPSDDEWKQLEINLGMPLNAVDSSSRGENIGNKMKEPGIRLWDISTDYKATNESEFTIKPGGTYSLKENKFYSNGNVAAFWAANTDSNNNNTYTRMFQSYTGIIMRGYPDKKSTAYSVRCIKNE
jgi:uncharacterized protein (TIGR02145 family)